MSLSVAEQFYIAQHRNVPEKELASTLSLPVKIVREALKKLTGEQERRQNEFDPDKIAGFDVYNGTVSMTPRQAADDDEQANTAGGVVRRPGIFIMNPEKPVR